MRHGRMNFGGMIAGACALLAIYSVGTCELKAETDTNFFQVGLQAYSSGEFGRAAQEFGEAARTSPTVGALHNLGNAEWKCGRPGQAILAWEQAQWVGPFHAKTSNNLKFVRQALQLESPELSWYEICSTWLPTNAWVWIACISFWLAVAMMVLPGTLRWRKSDWHQGLAVAAFALFLLTIPALVGVQMRTKLGIVLSQEAPLRLTPTSEAQILMRLRAGEGARFIRQRGKYIFIRTSTAAGWVEQGQFGLISKLTRS